MVFMSLVKNLFLHLKKVRVNFLPVHVHDKPRTAVAALAPVVVCQLLLDGMETSSGARGGRKEGEEEEDNESQRKGSREGRGKVQNRSNWTREGGGSRGHGHIT